jgi:hypothetical protein
MLRSMGHAESYAESPEYLGDLSAVKRGDGVPAIHVSLIGTLRKKRNELVYVYTVTMPRGVAVARGTCTS